MVEGKYVRKEDGAKMAPKGGQHTQFIYVSDDLSQTQLMIMLSSDLTLAMVALISIAIIVLIHTGSLFLMFMGLMNVCGACSVVGLTFAFEGCFFKAISACGSHARC
jgi:hypothetical protein